MSSLFKNLDELFFRFINQALANPIGDAIFPCLNHAAPFVPLFLIVLGWIAYRNSRRIWLIAFLLILSVLLGDSLIFNPLKSRIARPRPAATLQDVRSLASGAAGGWSFPSSHTANAFLIAAILTFFFKKQIWIWISVAGFVAVARVYVGVHYPGDVLGSALLGWMVGVMFLFLSRKIYPALRPDSFLTETVFSAHPHEKTRKPQRSPWLFNRFSTGLWLAIAIPLVVQLLRFLWAATCDLDVPPACAQFWCLARKPIPTDHFFLCWLGKCWFALFGSSPPSLWAIPWSLQTLWVAALAWLAWKRGGLACLGSMVILTAILPLTAQLTFLGSPAHLFENADWTLAWPLQALVFYVILAVPLWITALLHLRSHPLSSGIALGGLVLASSFPALPWYFLALTATGPLLLLAERFGKSWSKLGAPESGGTRLLIFLLVVYGVILSVGVYNPRFLRKLGFTFLPRNNPQYVQTGWRECVDFIRPRLATCHGEEVWTDSQLSRDQLQYLLGRDYRVWAPDDGFEDGRFPEQPPRFYVQEVYLAQINPRVIFLRRRDWIPSPTQKRMIVLDATVIFRKGDPIRQFYLYLLDPDEP